MILQRATENDYAAIVELANLAYRGPKESGSWNTEAGLIGGQRLDRKKLAEDIAAKPNAVLLLYREDPGGELLGTVWLEPLPDDVWYLGLLTIRPGLQNQQLGRKLLAAAEDFAKDKGARLIRMTVIQARDMLIAWYERRGYARTGETQPFPYGDERFGIPFRDDLHFVVLQKSV